MRFVLNKSRTRSSETIARKNNKLHCGFECQFFPRYDCLLLQKAGIVDELRIIHELDEVTVIESSPKLHRAGRFKTMMN